MPRMADFAEWGEATARGLGWGDGTFVTGYNDNRQEATHMLLDESPLALALLKVTRDGVNWSGTAVNLYEVLAQVAGKKAAASARWPKNISMFGNELRRLAPQVRLHGLSIQFERKGGERTVSLRSDGATSHEPTTHQPK
jgi:hypothetical protein